jgi:hypothetical protein
MRPERRPGRIDGGDAIDRIESDRHDQIDADQEWDAEPHQAVRQESLPTLALQARPNEQAGQKKHELHQIEKLKCAKKIEAEPTLVIDNRENPPIVGRQVERRRCRGLRNDIGGKRMEGDNEEQQNAPQILERQAGFRHFRTRQNKPQSALRMATIIPLVEKTSTPAAVVPIPGHSFMMNS